MKISNILLISLIALASCKKENPEPKNQSPSESTTAQTMTLPVYLGDPALINYFDNSIPMVRITENGTNVESTPLVNVCSSINGNSVTLKYGKTYSVVFGLYVDNVWAQWEGFSGTMTVDNNGNISGNIGVGVESVLASKAINFGGCGFTVAGEILLFF